MPKPKTATSKLNRKYLTIRDTADRRDYLMRSGQPVYSNFNLLNQLGPVKDQGNEGSCTGNAGAGHTETVIFKQFNNRVVLSPAFLYYKEREMEGTLPEDSGAQSRTIFQVLNQFGCCVESADPYNTANMNVPPTQVQLNDAALRKIGAYHRILDVGSVMSCIESGYTCTIAIAVYQSFEDAASGIIPLPNKSTEGLLGGHEMYLWGFDIQGNAAWNPFKVPGIMFRNSWGPTFGWQGNGVLPLAYFNDVDLWYDSWMGHYGPPWAAKN